MKALLDTHAFLWALAGDARMSRHARDVFAGSADLFLSMASIWEIVIDVQSRKLNLPGPAGPYVLRSWRRTGSAASPSALIIYSLSSGSPCIIATRSTAC